MVGLITWAFLATLAVPLAWWRGKRRKAVCRASVDCFAYADPECGSGYCTEHCRNDCRGACFGKRTPKPCRHCGLPYHQHASPKCTLEPTFYEPT